MQALLANLELNDTQTLDSTLSKIAQRKESVDQPPQPSFIPFLDPNQIDAEEEGFVSIESTSRLKVLKNKQSKPTLLQNLQVNFQPTVTQSTFALSAKKKKLKNKYTTKTTTIKLKFHSIGNVKSDWKEVVYHTLPNLSKTKVEFDIEVLKPEESLKTIKKSLFGVSAKRPKKLKFDELEYSQPMNLIHDEYLLGLYEGLELEEGQSAFLMPDYVFMSLATVSKKEFPRNIGVKKEGQKCYLYTDVKSDNPFGYLTTYNENNLKDLPDNEAILGEAAERATFVEEIFQKTAVGINSKKINYKENFRYLKITIDKDTFIFTKVHVDAVDSNNKKTLIRTLYDDKKSWKNFDKKYDFYINSALSDNIGRVAEWFAYATLTGAERMAVGCVGNSGKEGALEFSIKKVENKSVNEIRSFFNLKETDAFVSLKNCLKLVKDLKEDGNYMINKAAFKPTLTVYKTP